MQEYRVGRVVKIMTPFQYVISDDISQNIVKIQLKPTNNKYYQHLLPQLYAQKIQYSLQKKTGNKIREEFKKGVIYLQNQDITLKYSSKETKVYMDAQITSQTILQCFVSKIECLKLDLIILNNSKYLTFYFSELKLIRLGNIHPKQMWERAHSYFKQQLEGEFIQLTVSGSEKYKEEVNIYGQIIRIRDNTNIKEKIIIDGYGELSKNPEKYVSKERIEHFNILRDEAKNKNKGMWETSKNINKSNMQAQQFKYKQWEQWIKDYRQIPALKNEQDELKTIVEEITKICKSQSKIEYNKIKIVLDTISTLFDGHLSKKYFKFYEQIIKVVCNFLNNIYISIYQHIDNIDFIKSLNKILIFLGVYHAELEKYIEASKGEKIQKVGQLDFQKAIKLIFKLCFLGNETFHDKIFGGKRKQHNYEEFSFQGAYLQGFSSLSECSDYEDGDKLSKQQKKQRKLLSAHQKIRINATNVMSYLFKHYNKIIQTYWQMCVTSNIISPEFLTHVKKLKLTTNQVKMNGQQKKEIANLMKANFGDQSLILLSIFQKNNKVRANSISCLLNMIANFQGKKLIAAAQRAYVQKLLKSTKSSFVPKSFIIFSGLRNALYFLLFALYYEKNLPIIIMIFKTLCQLCNNCSFIDKMSFEQGMGLLMRNYILPVLQFEWSITQLEELKILCINFLSVLVNNNRKWDEIEDKYFKSNTSNVNLILLSVIKQHNKLSSNQEKLTTEILNYFTKLSKKYFSIIFFKINGQRSIWTYLEDLFINKINYNYSEFVQQVFKGYLDQIQSVHDKRQEEQICVNQQTLATFFTSFLKVYSQEVTQNNYQHILSTLTYIDYDYWGNEAFEEAKSFLLHCFYSFIGQKYSDKYQFSSIDGIKNNSLIRILLIKLVGYMSFCPEFQTDQITKKSVKFLLQLSKTYKSFNSLIKISWGLSNWAKVPNLPKSLNQKQLKQCLDYMMKYSESDKQKIASNCTRGIGFFVANVGKKFDLKECRNHIIKNLTHSIIKVRTNSTKTLITLSQDLVEDEIKNLVPTLQQNILKNNYHLQMETLHLLKKLEYPIKGSRLLKLFVSILKNLLSYTTMEYEFSQIKTIRELRFTVLSQIFTKELCQLEKHPDLAKDILVSIYAYLTRDCKEQSQRQSNSKVIGNQFQKSEEAREVIFNKSKGETYNEEKIISSEIINKGLIFKASSLDLNLIKQIKKFSQTYGPQLEQQWNKLSNMRIESNTIFVDFAALQMSEIYEEQNELIGL